MKKLLFSLLFLFMCSFAIADEIPYDTTGLVGWWKMNDNLGTTQVLDYSVEGNHGTLSDANNSPGATTAAHHTNGVYQGAVTFDGVDDYVSISADSNFNFAGEFTIHLWVNTSDTGDVLLLDKRGASWSTGDFGINFGNTGAGEVSFNFNDGATVKLDTNINIADNSWHQVVVTRDSLNKIRVYIDTFVKVFETNSIALTNNDALYLASVGGRSNWFNGTIDEVRIFSRALSAEEIKANYLRGTKVRGLTLRGVTLH